MGMTSSDKAKKPDGDEDMLPVARKRKAGGVKRTISKDKDRAKRQIKALAKLAKAKGIMSEKRARIVLMGKKPRDEYRPNGWERTRAKKIRVKRQQRERRGYSKRTEWSDDEEFSDFEE